MFLLNFMEKDQYFDIPLYNVTQIKWFLQVYGKNFYSPRFTVL